MIITYQNYTTSYVKQLALVLRQLQNPNLIIQTVVVLPFPSLKMVNTFTAFDWIQNNPKLHQCFSYCKLSPNYQLNFNDNYSRSFILRKSSLNCKFYPSIIIL